MLTDLTGEVVCSGHQHLEKLYLDEVFNLNVDKVFENIFTDSPFFRVFVGSQKTFGQSPRAKCVCVCGGGGGGV